MLLPSIRRRLQAFTHGIHTCTAAFLNMTASGMMLKEQHWPSSVMVAMNSSEQLNVLMFKQKHWAWYN